MRTEGSPDNNIYIYLHFYNKLSTSKDTLVEDDEICVWFDKREGLGDTGGWTFTKLIWIEFYVESRSPPPVWLGERFSQGIIVNEIWVRFPVGPELKLKFWYKLLFIYLNGM